jgi:uncharacterized integral membrane protein
MNKHHKDKTPFFALLIIAGIVAPLSIVLHESGHFLAYESFGYSPVLHYDGVSCGQPIQSDSQGIVIIGAGVGLTLALSLLSLVVFYYVRHPAIFVAGTILSARNIAALPIILLGITEPTDEAQLSAIFGLSYWPLYLAILMVNLVTIGLLVKFAKKNQKDLLIPTIIGGVIGVTLWLLWLGPSILP